MNDGAAGLPDRPENVASSLAGSLREVSVELVCPRCGETGQSPIVYGLPTWEAGERAKRGEVVLGGCFVMPADTACPGCGLEWESS